MSDESNSSFELKIKFKAPEAQAKAFYEALLLVCNAWSRHKRIENPNCEINQIST
ncbi:MAG: hypothetical protein SFU25_11460 [Candidatus Caenarcaniphilales bacterium]|nr:hypothetical protein [Candidatus Caenarcaniphilales bacterium]